MMEPPTRAKPVPDRSPGDPLVERWSPELLEIYETSAEGFVRMASVLLGRRAEAEEVVQDAFAAAAAKGDQVDNPGAYVRRSVVNGCYGLLRKRRTAERHEIDPPPPQAPDHLVEFRDVLLALPWAQRAVIVLRFLDGRSVRETAEIVGCRESTVRSHSARGLRALRRELTP